MGQCADDIDGLEKEGEGTVGTNDTNEYYSHMQCIVPLVTASSAQPDPEAPPPIIRISKLSV